MSHTLKCTTPVLLKPSGEENPKKPASKVNLLTENGSSSKFTLSRPLQSRGFKKGDIIKSINNEQPSPWDAQIQSGVYIVRRGNDERKIKMTTATITQY